MKNSVAELNVKEEPCYRSSPGKILSQLKLIIFYGILFINTLAFQAQTKSLRGKSLVTGMELLSSGNGHGAFWSPYFGISKGNNAYFIGPLVHCRTGVLSGVKCTYSRNLSAMQYESND